MTSPTPAYEEIRKSIKSNLSRASGLIRRFEELMEGQADCEEAFQHFTQIKDVLIETESLLMHYHLEECLVPKLPFLNEIIDSLNRLARDKYGALVVIQREDDLEPHITFGSEAGTILDARISVPLLQSIFQPGNPLHDGAAIISGERIIGAGCVLPLSKKMISSEGKQLGTRHRAALGISEVTDAIVLVVSEEMNRISLAVRGKLLRLDKACDLRKKLIALLDGEVPA